HEFDISYGRFRKVADRALPIVLKDPGKNTVHPDTEAKREALAVVLFADVWKVNVAQLVFVVKIYEKTSVADGNITHRIARELVRIHSGLDREIEIHLDPIAKADDLFDDLAVAVDDERLRDRIGRGKDEARQGLFRIDDRVIKLCLSHEIRDLSLVRSIADVHSVDRELVAAVSRKK